MSCLRHPATIRPSASRRRSAARMRRVCSPSFRSAPISPQPSSDYCRRLPACARRRRLRSPPLPRVVSSRAGRRRKCVSASSAWVLIRSQAQATCSMLCCCAERSLQRLGRLRLIRRKKSRSDPTAEPIALHLHPIAFPVGNLEARAFGGGRKHASGRRGRRPDVHAGPLQENDVLLLRGRTSLLQRGVSIRRSRSNRGSFGRVGGGSVRPADRNRWISRRDGDCRRSLARALGRGLCRLHRLTRRV